MPNPGIDVRLRMIVPSPLPDPIGDVLRADAIGYWKLEEASGIRKDATGNGTDMAPVNSPGNITGRVGDAINFVGGLNQYLQANSNPNVILGTGEFTFSCWMLLNDNTYSNEFVIKDDVVQPYEYSLFTLVFGGIGLLAVVEVQDTQFNAYSSSHSTPLQTGTWYFIVGWRDNVANTLRISVNNVESYFGQTSLPPGINISGSAPFTMGWDISNPPNTSMNGYLDEVGFWKRSLTQTERDYLWNNGKGKLLFPY